MTAADLLHRIRAAGLTIAIDGEQLVLRPREFLTQELLAEVREHKAALLAELMVPTPSITLTVALRWLCIFAGELGMQIGDVIGTLIEADELAGLLVRDPVAVARSAKAANLGPPYPAIPLEVRDDRITCGTCMNLRADGRCAAAERGTPNSPGSYTARQDYVPFVGKLRRCAGYEPMPENRDQRIGRYRWPWLTE